MNDRLLRVAVALSVFAMVGVALMGTAAAQDVANANINDDPVVRADDPGTYVQFEFDDTSQDNTQETFTIDVSELNNAGITDVASANIAVDGPGTVNTIGTVSGGTFTVDYTDAGGAAETVTVEIGGNANGANTAPSGAVATNDALALHSSGASTGSYELTVEDGGGNSVSTQGSINEDDINLNNLGASAASFNLDVEADLSVDAEYNSDSEPVVSTNSEAEITVGQPSPLGDETVLIDEPGALTAAGTFDTSLVAAQDGFVTQIEGDHDLDIAAGDVTDGVVSNTGTASSGNAFDVEDLRLDLDTPESVESDEDVVLYDSSQTVSGSILRTSEDAPTQVLADSRVVDYQILDVNGATVANDDTGNGQFSVSETWDATETLDDDDGDTYERLDGVPYVVSIQDTTSPASGGDLFNTILDIEFEIDGVPADQADVTFDDTVQISGTVLDGQGNPISGYRITNKLYAGSSVPSPQEPKEVGTTTTGNNGQFSFTSRLNDGVQDPFIGEPVGANTTNIGVHLGTHQVDGTFPNTGDLSTDVRGGNNAPTPHPAVHYQTVETQPQEDIIEVTADNNAPVNFEDTYRIRVTDRDGNPLGPNEAEILVEGNFDEEITGIGDLDTAGVFVDSAIEDVGGTGPGRDTIAFQANPDADGFVNFTATPLEGSFEVSMTGEDRVIDTIQLQNIRTIEGGPNPGDDLVVTRATEPDYEDSTTFPVGAADPVNIIDEDVEDPRDGNPEDGSGELDVTDSAGNADFESVFASGPDVVEVLPLADNTGDRIENNFRLGIDTNFELDGITAYRVQFELRDEDNNPIIPSTFTPVGNEVDDFERIEIDGAGINGSIFADISGSPPFPNLNEEGQGISDARYIDIDSDGDEEYTFLLQPTSVEDQNPTIDHSIKVDGEDPVSLDLDADGLEIAEFTVDGQTTDAIEPNQNVDVTANVEDATQSADGVPINNGRVRLSQNGTLLGDFDARTSNTNDGEYSFQDIGVGPRGFDTDSDGIGEEVSTLDFTAYQYTDANNDQQLRQREVNKATVEQLDLTTDDLEVEYDPSNTSKYSGVQDGAFTLTRGVEYEQIAFELTDDQGNAVNLKEGLGGNTISDINFLAHDFASAPGTGNPELVTLTTGTSELSVKFDTAASDPANGFYVISDIERGANVDTGSSGFSNSDTFVINAPNPDSGPQAFTLNVETPDRSLATDEGTGTFLARDANVDTEVIGVAGNAVPNSVNDGDNTPTTDGDLIDELGNNQTDISQGRLNTDTSEIETPTAGVNRVYRIDATATDALGTPLSDADFNDIRADFEGSTDPPGTAGNDVARFEMVEGSDVSIQSAGGIIFGSGATNNDEVLINNEDGEFRFDIEVESAGDDAVYTPIFEIDAQANTGSDPTGSSLASQSPDILNPLVNVFDENGGNLPVNNNTAEQNQILANNLRNDLRVEAFPADEDGFVLPDGLQFTLTGPTAENQVQTTTQNIEDVAETDDIATEGFEEGQIGFFQATPTGTGIGSFNPGSGQRLFFGPTPVLNLDEDGNVDPAVFDVLRSNRQLNLGVSPSDPTGLEDNVTITATDANTGNLVETVSVTAESPDGDTTTVLTDANGEAVVPDSFIDETGTYEIDTRRAGYGETTASFSVDEVGTGPGPSPSEVVDAIRGAGNDPNTLERQSIQDAIFEFVVGDGTFNGTEMTRDGLEEAVFQFVSN